MHTCSKIKSIGYFCNLSIPIYLYYLYIHLTQFIIQIKVNQSWMFVLEGRCNLKGKAIKTRVCGVPAKPCFDLSREIGGDKWIDFYCMVTLASVQSRNCIMYHYINILRYCNLPTHHVIYRYIIIVMTVRSVLILTVQLLAPRLRDGPSS